MLGCSSLGFFLKALQGLPVLRAFGEQGLDGDRATDLGVGGSIDPAHAALVDQFEILIA
jgi:hypothetical protein